MYLGETIKEYRQANNMSMQAFADRCGLSKGYIAMLERNINSKTGESIIPSLETFIKVSNAMHINLDKLLAMIDENQPIAIPPKSTIAQNPTLIPVDIGETVRIPVYGRIPAGIPREAIEDITDYIDVEKSIADKYNLLALEVAGDSMYPTYLNGDYVLIKEQPDCESGQVCAVRINGNDVTLKKVIKEIDGIMLQPINPEYQPKKYDYNDELNPVEIIGVVIELRRKV